MNDDTQAIRPSPADSRSAAPSPAPPGLSAELVRELQAASGTRGRSRLSRLEERSGLAADAFVAALGAMFRYPVASLAEMQHWTPAFDVLPLSQAMRRECLAFEDGAGGLRLVLADPFDTELLAWADASIECPFAWVLVHHGELAAYLSQQEEGLRAMDAVLAGSAQAGAIGTTAEDLSLKMISEDTSPVVRLVHSIIYDGLKTAASDIHLETDANGLVIKYRIDGVLGLIGTTPGVELAERVISRIKVMSELDIAERRVPQDGRFKVTMQGREIDFRVSIMPSIFGEDAVLRILDRRALVDHVQGLSLANLGFDPGAIANFRRLISEPYGMVLVTGPTGSGKTTTVYAAVCEINRGQDKFITIEDPVEYQLAGVLQIQVNEKKGLSFARGLRSILRHDPDKILVGEIRDPETAQIAVQAALTGHMVFTTVHANNVFDVISRFMHMGVDPYAFVSALNGILAQRLVRLSCMHCAVDERPDEALLRASGIAPGQERDFRFRAGHGCSQCRGTGYRGRKAIAEMLNLTDEIREMIVAREPIRRVKEAARRDGTRYLREAALELVRRGETTLQEINRVTFVA
ncbi:GspE/PulE family protein [Thauera chlorobenzoica]|uniref:Type II secretion system, GspE-like protein n=1 Tax=Thauera chlorobenzoica TaxID=96773 RepID=A0A1H5RUQ8_9RHOO|nr:GspE/PulE family protein [Thauera chlorobenzoica]APR05151.1 type II secretion system, GspE-like protein [Thauera chlorobenzoica]SEF41428.1 general secretion pathway protein E [Thauera chlorobenzoica]